MKKNGFAAILAAIFCVLPVADRVFAGTGTIIFTEGRVAIKGKPAKPGDTVSVGDEVATGDDSSCEIAVGGAGILRIKDNARIVFNIDDGENSGIEILRGWFAAIFRKKPVKIKTPTVIAGVRGTLFCINVENDETVYACTCNGTIDWQGKGQDRPEKVTAHHHAGRYHRMAAGKTVATEAGMKYHTDADLEELAVKIKSRIDWTKPE